MVSAGINNFDGMQWTSEELRIIARKCKDWWQADRYYLPDAQYKVSSFGGSLYKEFFSRFQNLSEIIGRVLGYQKAKSEKKSVQDVFSLIGDMERLGLNVLREKNCF